MSDRVYKILLSTCLFVGIAGCAVVTVNLKQKYDNHRVEVVKQQAKDILEDAMNSTVLLLNADEKGNVVASGTGFVVKVDDQGSWIVSNKHVCMGSRMNAEILKREGGVYQFLPIMVVPRRGRPSGAAITRLGTNSDLCLIRTELKFKKPLKLAKTVKKGDQMFTFGFPGGRPEVNKGKYMGTEADTLQFFSHTDMKIWYGASGSAALNMQGEVIGVMAMIRFDKVFTKKNPPKREDVSESMFIPLEILREFIGGL